MRAFAVVDDVARVGDVDARYDVVVLERDVEALEADWVERLRAAAYSDTHTGIAGCRFTSGDGTLRHAGLYVIPDTGDVHATGGGEIDLGQYLDTRAVDGVWLACAYIRREVVDAIGPPGDAMTYCRRAAEHHFGTVCCGALTVRSGRTSETARVPAGNRYSSSLAWQSLMNLPIGYATSSREILRALDQRGVRLTYEYAYGAGTPWPFEEPDLSGDPLLDAMRSRPEPRRPPVVVTYAAANVFERNHGDRRVGFTMIEVDGFPREWVRQANRMDEIWTPTEFNREGLLRSGVTRPVHIVPLGVDTDHFHPLIARIPNPRGDYVFLANFEWGSRKAPDVLLRAFNRTFRSTEPAILVCRILNRQPAIDVRNEILSLGLDPRGGRTYFLYNQEMPHYQLATLYRSADCFVSPSRGEGWGLPVLEAMACGLPVIATDWGGQRAVLDAGDTYPLRARTVPAHDFYQGFQWAEPDEEHLRHLLRHVHEHREEARSKGMCASERVRMRFTWQQTASAIQQHLGRLRDQ